MTTPRPRIYTTSFASIYPLYLQKARRKGRTKALRIESAPRDLETIVEDGPRSEESGAPRSR